MFAISISPMRYRGPTTQASVSSAQRTSASSQPGVTSASLSMKTTYLVLTSCRPRLRASFGDKIMVCADELKIFLRRFSCKKLLDTGRRACADVDKLKRKCGVFVNAL